MWSPATVGEARGELLMLSLSLAGSWLLESFGESTSGQMRCPHCAFKSINHSFLKTCSMSCSHEIRTKSSSCIQPVSVSPRTCPLFYNLWKPPWQPPHCWGSGRNNFSPQKSSIPTLPHSLLLGIPPRLPSLFFLQKIQVFKNLHFFLFF